jgi:hypothetical protein
MFATSHKGMNNTVQAQLSSAIEKEQVSLERSQAAAADRALADEQLPPYPTPHTSLLEAQRVREKAVRYIRPHSAAPSVGRRPARELPVRGPNRPSTWVPERKPPAPGMLSSSLIGLHLESYAGLYEHVRLPSADGQAQLQRLRDHRASLPPVPSLSRIAAPAANYSLKNYNHNQMWASEAPRLQLESGNFGAFLSRSVAGDRR